MLRAARRQKVRLHVPQQLVERAFEAVKSELVALGVLLRESQQAGEAPHAELLADDLISFLVAVHSGDQDDIQALKLSATLSKAGRVDVQCLHQGR